MCGVRNADEEKKRKKPSRVRKATAFVPFAFAVQTPLDASGLGRFRGRNARSGDKTRSVASVFADGDEPSGTRACGGQERRGRAGGASARFRARHRTPRESRRTSRRVRRVPRRPTRQIPRRETQPVLIVIVRYFSCACFERWRETQGGDGRRRALHADAARRTMAPASRDVPCRRAWTCGSWLCRCTRRSTPADLPRRPTEGAICGTAWRGRAGTARRTPGARPAAG